MSNVLKGIIKIETPGVNEAFDSVARKAEQSLGRINNSVRVAHLQFRQMSDVSRTSFPRVIGNFSDLSRAAIRLPSLTQRATTQTNILSGGFNNLGKTAASVAKSFVNIARVIPGIGFIGLLALTARLIRGFKQTSEEVKKAEEQFKSLGEKLAGQVAPLTTIVGLIKNTSTSIVDKQKALELLNEQYGGYLKNINEEKITLANIDKAYNDIIKVMIRQAVVRGIQDQITESIKKTAAEIVKLQLTEEKRRLDAIKKAEEETNKKKREAQKQEIILANLERILQKNSAARVDGLLQEARAYNEKTAAVIESGNANKSTEKKIDDLTEILKLQLAPLLNLSAAYEDINLNQLKPPPTKDFDAFSKIMEETNLRVLKYIKLFKEGKFKAGLFPQAEVDLKNIDKVRERIADIETQLKTLSKIIIPGISFSEQRKELEKELEFLKKILAALSIPVDVKLKFNFKELSDTLKEEINKIVLDVATGLAEGIGAAIGTAIAGGKGAFAEIINVFSEGLKAIGSALIKFGITKSFTDKLLKSGGAAIPGGLAIAAGILAIAFSNVLKATKLPGRALGGTVNRGTAYLVGERGAEVFVPSSPGTIIPNHSISNIRSYGFSWAGEVVFRIGNNELIGTLSKGQRSQKRLV